MSKGRALSDAEAVLTKATKKEHEGDWQTAYQLYTQAAQTLFEIYGATKDKIEKADSKRLVGIAVERAQKLKKADPDIKVPSRDLFSAGEQNAVLVASSLVNGTKYPQWTNPTLEETLQPLSYRDQNQLLDRSAHGWEQAQKVIGSPPMVDYKMLPAELVQSIVPNCSVVASVIVCWNHHLRHNSKLMLSRLFPQSSQAIPLRSTNNKYHYQLFINGCSRRSTFDSWLPMQDGQLMCMTAGQSSCMWPILVEKAYMKYNGGYDFSGSDSGADLRALVGWIPEYRSFRSSSFEQEKTWKSLVKAFHQGNVLITLATGTRILAPRNGQKLLPRHAYACIDLEDSDERLLTIVNPWRQAESLSEDLSVDMDGLLLASRELERPKLADKYWELSWEDVCSTFNTLCLSWNPDIFPNVIDHHRIWKSADRRHDAYSTDLNHQIRVSLDKDAAGTEIWALLSRHVVERHESVVYIALHAFEEDGNGAGFVKPENLTIRGKYHEGPHCLVKLSPGLSTNRISFIASLYFGDTTTRDVAYTLTLYSNRKVSFDTSPMPSMTTKQARVEFNAASSGGNVWQPTYFHNPQWRIKLFPPDPINGGAAQHKHIRVVLRAFTGKDIPLNIKVYRTSQRRVNDDIDGHVAFDSGTYNFGLTFGQVDLPVGEYAIILSTFTAGQYGAATLEVSSTAQFTLDRLQAEGAGMHLKTVKGVWDGPSAAGGPSFKKYWNNPIFEMNNDRPTDIIVRLQAKPGTTFLPINITLFNNSHSLGETPTEEVTTSGQYRESVYGVRITQFRIPQGSYLLVPSTYSPGLKGDFEISVWSDVPLTIQPRDSPN